MVYLIIITTVIISVIAFNRIDIFDQFEFNAHTIHEKKQ
jgi:hypothetical protein